MRESEIEAYLVRRVKELGGEVRKVKWIGRRGAPDRVVMLPEKHSNEQYFQDVLTSFRVDRFSQTMWIEFKAPGKKPEPHQLREHKRMQAMGQRVEVVDSFERVDEVLS